MFKTIRDQIHTFFVAGHDTTSGLLSFAIYYLVKHPAVLSQAYAEVDNVLGTDLKQKVEYKQVNELEYLKRILKESLRLMPPVPGFTVMPKEDTVLAGKYAVKKGEPINALLAELHRDKAVWGENPNLFDPDRFLPEIEAQRPINAYKPFGNGKRACIGSQFAIQEATLILGVILKNFTFVDSKDYQLRIHRTLTVKPDNFKLQVRKRDAQHRLYISNKYLKSNFSDTKPKKTKDEETKSTKKEHKTPVLVLYGSNMGSSKQFAQRMANDAQAYGYEPICAAMDDYAGKLPKRGLVSIIMASYNGKAPDNASKFCKYLENLNKDELKGVQFTVFGTGDRDWRETYQAIPKYIYAIMQKLGAKPLLERGEADAKGDFFENFDEWYASFFSTLGLRLGLGKKMQRPEVSFSIEKSSCLSTKTFEHLYQMKTMSVLANEELVDMNSSFARSKRHIRIALPEGSTYQTGDHLAVLGKNPLALVEKVTKHFHLDADEIIVL